MKAQLQWTPIGSVSPSSNRSHGFTWLLLKFSFQVYEIGCNVRMFSCRKVIMLYAISHKYKKLQCFIEILRQIWEIHKKSSYQHTSWSHPDLWQIQRLYIHKHNHQDGWRKFVHILHCLCYIHWHLKKRRFNIYKGFGYPW